MISLLILIDIVPPYRGVPSLSHQLPVLLVLDVVVAFIADVDVVVIEVAEVVVTLVCGDVGVDVGVDVEVVQDARSIDKIIPMIIVQSDSLFIESSCYSVENIWKIDYARVLDILLWPHPNW